MLTIELKTQNIPEVFDRFRNIIGERYWLQRIAQIKSDIRLNPFLKNFLREEHTTTFALARCSELAGRYGHFPLHEVNNRELYPALAFAAQVLSILDSSSSNQAHQLVRRIQGAIRRPSDMHAIQLELGVATHFSHRGHTLRWPEMEGIGTFDLLIQDLAEDGLEIECKSISNDKGRKIHREEALGFNHILSTELRPASKNLSSGLCVVITIPSRLPTKFIDRQHLAKAAVKAILSGKSLTSNPDFEIRVTEISVNALCQFDAEGKPQIERQMVDQVTGTKNREIMILGNSVGGCIACVLQSQNEDSMLRSVFDTLSQSAKNQLSGKRPAIMMAGFQGIDPEQLVSVAQKDSGFTRPATALSIAVNKYLSSQDRNHVVGVGFLSRSELEPLPNGIVESGGSAYFFPKNESPFWNQEFTGLFS